MLQPNQDQLHSDQKIAIHHRSNFLHIGCEIAECKDLQIPGGGARQPIALRAFETANPRNKWCLSQASGSCTMRGLSPEAVRHVYLLAILPINNNNTLLQTR